MERENSILENMAQGFCSDTNRQINSLVDEFEVYHNREVFVKWQVFERITLSISCFIYAPVLQLALT